MGATLDKPTQTDERVRARATVLLMVVALLAALFMVGAALLSSVTFQSRSLTAAEEQQTQSTVIDALSREIGTALREAAVGADGKPWNQDSTSNIGNDICGGAGATPDNSFGGNNWPERHNDGTVFGFADGHVKWQREVSVDTPVFWDPPTPSE